MNNSQNANDPKDIEKKQKDTPCIASEYNDTEEEYDPNSCYLYAQKLNGGLRVTLIPPLNDLRQRASNRSNTKKRALHSIAPQLCNDEKTDSNRMNCKPDQNCDKSEYVITPDMLEENSENFYQSLRHVKVTKGKPSRKKKTASNEPLDKQSDLPF